VTGTENWTLTTSSLAIVLDLSLAHFASLYFAAAADSVSKSVTFP
jgi:hypothetical protein